MLLQNGCSSAAKWVCVCSHTRGLYLKHMVNHIHDMATQVSTEQLVTQVNGKSYCA